MQNCYQNDESSVSAGMSRLVTACVMVLVSVAASKAPPPLHDVASPQCVAHVTLYLAEARRGVSWALHMLDASTKLMPDGVLFGNTNQLGSFDQCLAVTRPDFQGRYCRATLEVEANNSGAALTLTYATCLPSSCLAEDVAPLLQEHVAPLLDVSLKVHDVHPADCYVLEPSEPLTAGAIAFVTTVALLASLVAGATVLEWRGAAAPWPLLSAFSARVTVHQLFSTRREPGALGCLHGLRVGSILWVLLGHRYGQQITGAVSNLVTMGTYFERPITMTIGNGFMSVDTFFLLSGLLLSLSFLREMERGATFDIFKFYLYRYLRLAVPMGFVIFFYATVLSRLGSGPLWNSIVTTDAEFCQRNWWANMIYLNNYYHQGNQMCLYQTWYLAVDMQLAWLSPLVLLPLQHSPRAGLQLTSLLVAISCLIPFAITYVYKFPMTGLHIPIEYDRGDAPDGNFGFLIYDATQSRATPYLCGLLLGYLLFRTSKLRVAMSRALVAAGWAGSAALCLTVVYSLSVSYQPNYVYDDLAAAFYAGFHRLAWSAGIAWIIFACVKGYGGPVDRLLSWRLLLPLSRLSYGVYLVHFVVIKYDRGSVRTPSRFDDVSTVHAFLGDLVPVFALALVLYMLVEAPLLNLLKIAFAKGKKKAATASPSGPPVAAALNLEEEKASEVQYVEREDISQSKTKY